MLGCFFSERFYTSNVQKKAVILAYVLTVCSGVGFAVFSLIKDYDTYWSPIVIYVGYFLSGTGQALLLVVMAAYATMFVQNNPNFPIMPVLFGLINFSGLIGVLLNFIISFIHFINSAYILLALNAVVLGASISISWGLKGSPKIYVRDDNYKPDKPFTYYSVVFYTYGVINIQLLFGLYSGFFVNYLEKHKHFSLAVELCIYQSGYSLAYLIGAAIVAYSVRNDWNYLGYITCVAGVVTAGCGFLLIFLDHNTLKTDFLGLWITDVAVGMLGINDGILEPYVLHTLASTSNRPEFFTGLFYFLSSITSIFVLFVPPYRIYSVLTKATLVVFLVMTIASSRILRNLPKKTT
jgi:hypothetical protein